MNGSGGDGLGGGIGGTEERTGKEGRWMDGGDGLGVMDVVGLGWTGPVNGDDDGREGWWWWDERGCKYVTYAMGNYILRIFSLSVFPAHPLCFFDSTGGG